MLTILDKYILKRYLATFATMLLMFVPIGIIIDVSEKINFMIENEVPFLKIAVYYYHFTIYFANALFPIFLFLSIIWFTSKLANNTEIIAILSSGISFTRFLRPYIIGASLVTTSVALLPFTVVKNDESTSEKSKPEKSTGNDNDDSVFYGKKDQPNKKVDKKQPETIVDPAGEKTMKTDRPRNRNAIEGKKAEINSDAAANVSGKSGKSKSTVSETGTVKDQKLEDSESSNEPEGNGEEAGEQSAAFNPETGEINWDCPCLGGMAHGPCGEEFKAAFSCFVYSETEPKGIDCIQAFEDMRTCFSRHPEHYKEELYEDDDKTSSESENFDDTTVDIPKVA